MELSTESSRSHRGGLHPELDCSWKPFGRIEDDIYYFLRATGIGKIQNLKCAFF